MSPEEIFANLNARNRVALYACSDLQNLAPAEVLALMDKAALQGFRLGSNIAMSMVKGALLVQMTRREKRDAETDSCFGPDT